jgi:N6-adenosine-specific RNA methylase IME4
LIVPTLLCEFHEGDCRAPAVILADPPWAYRIAGVQGDVSAQYATMSYGELCALPVGQWTAPHAVLALWATWPQLDQAVGLMGAWGFDYVTGFPWIKTVGPAIRVGIGFWTQSVSEMVLIGRKGEPRRERNGAPVLGLLHREARQFYAPGGSPGTHSRKPAGLHEWLESQFDGPYLELFARRKRPGWITWGTDLGFQLTPGGVTRCAPRPTLQPELQL